MYVKVHIKVGNQVGVGEGLMITANNIIKKRDIHIYRRNLVIFSNLIMWMSYSQHFWIEKLLLRRFTSANLSKTA